MPFDTTTYPFIRGSTFKQNGQFRNKELLYEKYLTVARNRKREREGVRAVSDRAVEIQT